MTKQLLIDQENYNDARRTIYHRLTRWINDINKYINKDTNICIDDGIYQLVNVEMNKKTLGLRFVYLDEERTLRRRTLKHIECISIDGNLIYIEDFPLNK